MSVVRLVKNEKYLEFRPDIRIEAAHFYFKLGKCFISKNNNNLNGYK